MNVLRDRMRDQYRRQHSNIDNVRVPKRSQRNIRVSATPLFTSNVSRGAANPRPNFVSGEHDEAAPALPISQRDAALIAGEIT